LTGIVDEPKICITLKTAGVTSNTAYSKQLKATVTAPTSQNFGRKTNTSVIWESKSVHTPKTDVLSAGDAEWKFKRTFIACASNNINEVAEWKTFAVIASI